MRRSLQFRVLAAVALLITTLSMACRRTTAPDGPPLSNAAPDGPDAEVRDYRLRALAARVRTMPPGIDRDYFAGILASRSARADQAVPLLNKVLSELRGKEPQRTATALEALAGAYAATYRYRDAAQVYEELIPLQSYLPEPVDDDAALARILAGAPEQTVSWTGPVRVKTSRNPIGSMNAVFAVNGSPVTWLLDTGANYSVVSRTTAHRLGLTPLPGAASLAAGVTGLKSSMEVTVVPSVELGGATLHNVVAMVLDDANLRVGPVGEAYQIDAILGFPVLRALGRVTFTSKGEFLAGDAAGPSEGGAPIFMRGPTPAIECEVAGEPLLFTFDTGASGTDFSVRYYERFRQFASSWRTRTVESGGVGARSNARCSSSPGLN